MTGPAIPVTQEGQQPGPGRPASSGIGRAAALIAALTIAARVLGLVRTVVFAGTVQATCLGTAYVTANTLPNIVYDVVLGGALTSIMVPVLARPAARSADDGAAAAEVSQTSSALLTWTTIILVPVSLAIALAASPLARLLNPSNPASHCGQAQLVTVTGHMLVVFAPQVLLYGLAVVMYGILQAHRRFGAPALAPVLSSLVVIAAYLIFVPFGRADAGDLARLPLSAELILSVGTTAGVAALVLTALVPAWRLRLRLRPALRFPPGIARRAGGLAAFGIIALVAQDASQLVVIVLANGRGSSAAIVLYQYGWQVFEAAYAVLAISVAVSAFPALSVHEGADFDRTAASSVRTVLLTSLLGSALVLAIALPAARILAVGHPGVAAHQAQTTQLAAGLALFAPGLAGYGLVACLSRVLLAARRSRAAAIAVGGGWLIVLAADIILVHWAPSSQVVARLALGNTIGLTASGAALLVAVWRIRGRAALTGASRAGAAGLAAAVLGAAAGAGVSAGLSGGGKPAQAFVAVLAAACALAVFAVVALLLDGGELRAAAARIRRAVLR